MTDEAQDEGLDVPDDLDVDAEGLDVPDDQETVEDDDNPLDDAFDPTDIPEKFQGPEGRDEADIPEGVD